MYIQPAPARAGRWLARSLLAARGLQALLAALLLLAWSSDAHAYAWMIRHGYTKCSTCHTDPSGGETLTHMGRVQGNQLMVQPWKEGEPELTERVKWLGGLVEEPEPLRLGGSARSMMLYSLGDTGDGARLIPLMQGDIYGAADFGWLRAGLSVGVTKVDEASTHSRAAQLTSGDGVQLLSRSHWVGAELGEDTLLRVGRLNLPFGVRVPEHTFWTRDATKTDRESDQQHGIALAFDDGPWRGEFMAVLGNIQVGPDNYRERGYAGYAEYMLMPKLAVGATSMTLQSKAGPYFNATGQKTVRAAHGVMGRYSPMSALGLLAELDLLKTTGRGWGYTGFVQADYERWRGLHFLGTLELLDQGEFEKLGLATPGAGELAAGFWLSANWFFWDHLDARLDLVLREEQPTQLYAQLHYYF